MVFVFEKLQMLFFWGTWFYPVSEYLASVVEDLTWRLQTSLLAVYIPLYFSNPQSAASKATSVTGKAGLKMNSAFLAFIFLPKDLYL